MMPFRVKCLTKSIEVRLTGVRIRLASLGMVVRVVCR
jgi:hypothetical protein